MKSNFKFHNLCGTVYQQGNVLFAQQQQQQFLLSPVGNRVSVFDLTNNKSFTFPFQNRKNIATIALSPDSNLLLSIDQDGRALLINFRKGSILHHFNLKKPVKSAKFSPDGKFIAFTHGPHIQVWRTPNHLTREFAPFVLHRTYTGHHDDVLSIEWSSDSLCFLTTSKDMTARLFSLHPLRGFRSKTFAGHKDSVLGAYFSTDGQSIYTVSRDGAVFVWKPRPPEDDDEEEKEEEDEHMSGSDSFRNSIIDARWHLSKRHYLNQPPRTKVVCTAFHRTSQLLVIGFSNGVFGIWEITHSTSSSTFINIHTLSISQEKISSVAINHSGDWLAFGSKKLGQLLVWEWQSESYILKQQGHYSQYHNDNMNCLAFSPNDGGQIVATGGDDGKVKLWSLGSGFCFVTFGEHTASVSSVVFAPGIAAASGGGGSGVLFSASLDGTVRAYDLIRYRNFRTFASPSPVQFSSLAVDPSGEVVAAGGSTDKFEIFLWSVQTGRLLDVLAGHEAPVSALDFAPPISASSSAAAASNTRLVSGSWDGTVKLWDVFARSKGVETFQLGSGGGSGGADVLAVAFRPDGKELAVSTLDGQIVFFDVLEGKQTNVVDGRKDISGGRKIGDRTAASNGGGGKSFNSLAYTADGRCILAGGNSKYVVLYDVRGVGAGGGTGDAVVMLKKFQISENLSLDGTEEFLDSRKVNDAGINVDTIDDADEESDLEDRLDRGLPGTAGNRRGRGRLQEARTKCVRFSPTGRVWAAASTQGLLIYSLDGGAGSGGVGGGDLVLFDPFDLSVDLTPESTLSMLASKEYLTALIMAFRLNERYLITKVYESIPQPDIRLVTRQLPVMYLDKMLRVVAGHMNETPHLEFDLLWCKWILNVHGRYLRDRAGGEGDYAAVFRMLQKELNGVQDDVAGICDENSATLSYILDQQHQQRHQQRASQMSE